MSSKFWRSLGLFVCAAPHSYLRKNLEYVIARFESQDLTTVIELKYLLENVRFAHQLLSEHLPLDSFDVRNDWMVIYRFFALFFVFLFIYFCFLFWF